MPKIAAVQLNSTSDIEQNLKQTQIYLEQSCNEEVDIVMLPECFALMQSEKGQLQKYAEEDGNGKIQTFLSEQARKLGIWIIAGSLPIKSDRESHITNSCLVVNDQGERVARYDKIHLFDMSLQSGESYLESSYTAAGVRAVVVDSPVGKIGLSICYDLRFPELYRWLSHQGADILIAPSAFTITTGQAHWEVLLRARAIENLCYVIAPAQVGSHPGGRQTYGHTLCIDPWGEIVSCLDTVPGISVIDVDLSKLRQIRAQLPSQAHRKDALFNLSIDAP